MGRLTMRGTPLLDGEKIREHASELYWALKCYEDLKEAGRLIELPCAVGDTVYRTNEESKEPFPYVVFSEPFACFVKNLWGKEFFATKEEAEAKLKELEGDKE